MYEGIIETLIKLFAIITDYHSERKVNDADELVKSYLKENFSNEMAGKYLELYHEFVEYYHVTNREILYNADERLINHRYIEKICAGIVELFNLEARFMMLVQLLNFVKQPAGIDQNDLHTVRVVADGLKIDRREYEKLFSFYLNGIASVKDKNCLFVVNGNEKYHDPDIKHLYRKDQQIELELIRISSIDTLFFKYWGPRNLYLNGHRLAQNRMYVFPQGGILRTSRIIPIYYSSIMSRFIRQAGNPIIVYNAENIEYRFSRKVYGLHPFSFQERSGDLVGILGGSGVGKTTLLNVLNGKLKPYRGKITINGLDLHDPQNESLLKGVIGYVPQDDLLLEELTVYKNLEFNARFCFGNMNDEEIDKIIEQTLIDFDLVEARDLVVGSPLKKILSGGQRKRLNIALELMREPSVLLADEPTSGLSSSDSEKIMYLLKRQCLKGKLVIANIHQPASDIYKLFDRMIVMDKGGRVVFFGNPMEAVTYFKNEANYVNPDESECLSCGNVKTEQPLRIIEERMVDPFGKSIRRRKIAPEEWYERYKEKVEPRVVQFMKDNPVEQETFPKVKFKTPNWFKQLGLFLKRDFASKKSNRQYLTIALLEAPLLALILGFFSKYAPAGKYVFALNDNIPAFLFMSVVVALFLGLSISAEEIFKDRKILKREEFLELSRGAYISSKILMLFSISAFQVLTFVLIAYSMLGFEGLGFSTWAILFTTTCFANLLGLNLSAGLNSAVTIYVMIPLMLVPQLLLSGVIVDFNKMHSSMSSYTQTPLIGDLMTSRWSYEALAVNQYKNNQYEKVLFDLEREKNDLNFRTYYWFPQVNDYLESFLQAVEQADSAKIQRTQAILLQAFNELIQGDKQTAALPDAAIAAVVAGSLDRKDAAAVKAWLNSAQKTNEQEFNAINQQLTVQYELLLAKFNNDHQQLAAYRDRFRNEQLEALVRDKYSRYKVYLAGNRILQGDEPVYRKPAYDNGRAHFYASYKYLGKFRISTVLFNILLIWLFTFLLMVSLYFDLLNKTIGYVEEWRLLQLSKFRDKIFYNPMDFIKRKE
ncbi:ATP-binding cassette domain-containing protein [Roseimarinus sediminis]|uniref:ATP-binding cassette domain-containing protein n=1 Tax=Roseimarinus sediminis TaxID=1610899 RepID=UPI003D1AB6B2